ncbi:hypothetical protein GCM10007385_28610 [Tateyamaria omphalii]|uniref:ClbS/DfsB family four-helix bundle protein n=1 Tax=Tateyamaria omphalii TaxID=299262 RepID=UPI001671F2B9|nr:ClbS/DfsB family four-helix bundle protein [Tateyamaria omphalii]GGX58243.1 hypothetical protein GCM10007385_28610 [Tateyamaria omphalii]
MPAHTKTELAEITAKEFSKLDKLIATVPPTVALQKDADDTSIKDVIAHRAHWIGLFLGWYWDGQAGKTVHFPAEGYKWNELKRYNADLRKRQAHLDWPQAVARLKEKHDALTTFINDHSNDELYGGPMKGARNDWRAGRWAEASGPSHYRSAAKCIRAALRAQG